MALATAVDRTFSPFIALAEQVAKGGPFAELRANELAEKIVSMFGMNVDAHEQDEKTVATSSATS